MKPMNSKMIAVGAAALFVAVTGIQSLPAQQAPSVKRNIVLKQDMQVAGREAVMAFVEFPVGAAEGRHTHPAEVFGFVQEGELSLESEGKPTVSLKAGDVFYVAPGKIHQATNIANVKAKLAVVFVAEKGKPLTTPAK